MSDFNYKDKSLPKLTDEFKRKFSVNIKGKEAIKLEGLTAIAHEKGIWKLETEIIQYPTQDNGFTAICKTTLGGYDYDPITGKVREVEYTDIGDASPSNCSKMVATAYIRMASTRSQARVFRKYGNIDMACTLEMSDAFDEEQMNRMSTSQMEKIKFMIQQNKVTQETFIKLLEELFNHHNYNALSKEQADILINKLKDINS